MPVQVAYLAQGQLRVLEAGQVRARDFDSPFAARVRRQVASVENRNRWKTEGRSYAAQMGRPAGAAESANNLSFTGVSRGSAAGTFVHALDTGTVSGLFVVDAEGQERRLFHTERFDIRHVAAHPAGEWLACSLLVRNVANLALCKMDGSTPQEVTEGDSLDLAPSWIPGPGRRLVYQSAGLPRDPSAGAMHQPFSIEELDVDTGRTSTLAQDPHHDLLAPRVNAEGELFYIRCPHLPPRRSLPAAIMDAAMVPWRIGRGFIAFFDFFAKLQGQGPPPRAALNGGKELDDHRLKNLLLHGASPLMWTDAAQVARNPSQVSPAWVLMRQRGSAPPEEVQRGVFAFDLAPDNSLVWTDGTTVKTRSPAGAERTLVTDAVVHQVAWVA